MSEWRGNFVRFAKRPTPILFAVILIGSLGGTVSDRAIIGAANSFQTSSSSWNPNVLCTPSIVRITDITNNVTGATSLTSSNFGPGITTSVSGGDAKRWLTPGTTPTGWISPGPSCTITNSKGTIVSAFVEIDNIRGYKGVWEDCRTSYNPVNGGSSFPNPRNGCDTTGNICDPAIVGTWSSGASKCGNGDCLSATDPTCFGRIHTEIDGDWNVAGYCGPSTTFCNNSTMVQAFTTGSMMDVQGFVFWDPDHLTSQWHSFSGWELHPLTAWRFHQSSMQPDFSVSVPPSTVSVAEGSSATSIVTSTSLNGFSGTVNLSATASPAGPTAALSPVSVSVSAGGTSSSSLIIGAASTVAPGSYEVTVMGASGSLSHSALVSVNVVAPNDFTLSASPSYIAIEPGSTGSSIISLASLKGFSGTVSLSASISPSGPQLSIDPSNQPLSSGSTANSTLTISTTSTVLGGNYSIAVKGSGNGIAHTVTLKLKVGSNFTTSANPSSLTIPLGSSGQSAINLQSLGFAGTISLIANVSASDLTASLNPTSIALSPGQSHSSTLTVSSKSPGRYSVRVLETSGLLAQAVNLTVNVSDFSLSVVPTQLTVRAGSSGSFGIALTSLYGFSGNVNFNTQGLPGGIQAKLNPQSVTMSQGGTGTASMVITTSANTLAANYVVTVTGSGPNGLIQTAKVIVVVTGYVTTSANPVTVNILSGQSVNVQINVKSFGLKGTVSVNASVSPSGLTAALNPTSLSFNAGESHSSTLTVSSVVPGTYMVVVMAKMGSMSSSVTVTVNVADFNMTASPSQLTVAIGSSVSSNITLTSLYGFSGTVNLQASVTPSGPKLTLGSNGVSLPSGGTRTALLTISTTATTLPGNYTIILKATDGSLVHTLTIIVTVT